MNLMFSRILKYGKLFQQKFLKIYKNNRYNLNFILSILIQSCNPLLSRHIAVLFNSKLWKVALKETHK